MATYTYYLTLPVTAALRTSVESDVPLSYAEVMKRAVSQDVGRLQVTSSTAAIGDCSVHGESVIRGNVFFGIQESPEIDYVEVEDDDGETIRAEVPEEI